MGKSLSKFDRRRMEESSVFRRKSFFCSRKHSQFARISKGEQLSLAHFNEVVKHHKKKVFSGCFSYSGVGSLVQIEGIMNSDKYIDARGGVEDTRLEAKA